MPKQSQKSKSKRLTLRQKHKVLRKVKEHHKKNRRADKKSGKGNRPLKDPGIPSAWPFKEELIKEFAFQHAKSQAEEKEKKEARRLARQAVTQAAMEEDGDAAAAPKEDGMAALVARAGGKQEDFDTRKRARLTEDFASDKDNSRKAYFREFKKVAEMADVVIQVLDARDPLACRCPDVEKYIRGLDPNKRIILLLNKMDLVPREVGEAWLKYFREELPTVAFKCSTQQQASNIGQRRMPLAKRKGKEKRGPPGAAALAAAAKSKEDLLQSSTCLGAETLLQLLKNYTRNAGIKTGITVGVVGLPNVGKSSLINSLKRTRVAQVGNTPGVTKTVQEVHLDKHIKLLDSPGVVFAGAESDAAAVLRNCVKIERLEDPVAPVAEVLKRVPAKELMALYKIQAFTDTDSFLHLIAAARGKLRKGGLPNAAAAARIVLQDWYDGRIAYFTRPPARESATQFATAEVVAAWAKEFSADDVFAAEQSAVIAHLPGLDDISRGFFQAESAGAGAPLDLSALEAALDSVGEDEVPVGAKRRDVGEMAGSDDDEDSEDGSSLAGDDSSDDGEAAAEESARRKKELAAAVAAAAVAADPVAAGGSAAVDASVSVGGQNTKLYVESGQFNPHQARAGRKKQKRGGADEEKAAAVAAAVARKAEQTAARKLRAKQPRGGNDDDADFDFNTAPPAAGAAGMVGMDD